MVGKLGIQTNPYHRLPLPKIKELDKGQLISKTDWRALDSSKKQTDEFDLFAVKSKKSKQNKFVRSFFGRIYGAPICFRK